MMDAPRLTEMKLWISRYEVEVFELGVLGVLGVQVLREGKEESDFFFLLQESLLVYWYM